MTTQQSTLANWHYTDSAPDTLTVAVRLLIKIELEAAEREWHEVHTAALRNAVEQRIADLRAVLKRLEQQS